ncbi:MAG TPA: DNA polymerase III subunit delta' [Dissulfurispiraceae bacterium]|nr:DNA polymerase III subunit delta' [Dissulfurispiraceae bacterium]
MGFNEIKGHDRPIRILQGTIRKQRVPSAMLFSGDAGIGKCMTARAYIQALMCPSAHDAVGCGACSSCRRILSASHPDLLRIREDAGEIKVETIRSLEEFLSMKPLESPVKVVLVDGAESMNVNAANAFLKTLEEPPAASVIILVTPAPESLPDTIRSRCFQVRFSPLAAEQCREILAAVRPEALTDQNIRLVMGSPGFAIAGNPAADARRCLELCEAMLRGDAKEAWEDRESMEEWLNLVPLLFRDLAVAHTGGADPLLPSHRLSAPDVESVLKTWQEVQRVKARAGFHLNKSITWHYVSELMRSTVRSQDAGFRSEKR